MEYVCILVVPGVEYYYVSCWYYILIYHQLEVN